MTVKRVRWEQVWTAGRVRWEQVLMVGTVCWKQLLIAERVRWEEVLMAERLSCLWGGAWQGMPLRYRQVLAMPTFGLGLIKTAVVRVAA